MSTMDTIDRFVHKFEVGEDCWEWTAAHIPSGYGSFRIPGFGSQMGAHRAAWMIAVGPIPEGLTIDHLCRNKNCVNVDHMELVTAAENTRRGRGWLWQTEKTECPHGHPYDEVNTQRNGKYRRCRTCHNARERNRGKT